MLVAMQLIEAGSDTTREALNIFIMASLKYPETFQKARQEADSRCNAAPSEFSLPAMEDLEHIPYLNAIIKECLRWQPIFSVPPDHALTRDLEFEGYVFPAGTGFVINGVAVGNGFGEADQFKPERRLDGHEFHVTNGLWAFGGGRRICVGYRLAHRGLFLNITRLTFCYDFEAVTCQNSPSKHNDVETNAW